VCGQVSRRFADEASSSLLALGELRKRGWCRLLGLTPLSPACALAVRNQRILAASDARQARQRPAE